MHMLSILSHLHEKLLVKEKVSLIFYVCTASLLNPGRGMYSISILFMNVMKL